MSVWFKRVSAEQFSDLGTGFWLREYGACLWMHFWAVIRDVRREWYDLRNWFALLMLPVALVLSPLNMLVAMKQARKDRELYGLTVHNPRNIERLRAAIPAGGHDRGVA